MSTARILAIHGVHSVSLHGSRAITFMVYQMRYSFPKREKSAENYFILQSQRL
jgi:hypothetical protein